MKKYINPKMDVNVFDAESIMTASAAVDSYEDWTKTNNASTGILEFGNGVEVNMAE